MCRTQIAALVLLAGTVVACSSGRKSSAGFRLPDGDANAGKQVFVANRCHACHEVDGVEMPAPVADPPVPVRLGGEVQRLYSDGELTTAIVHPSYRLASAPRDQVASGRLSRMGDFTHTMTVHELVDLVAFLQTTYRQAPLDVPR